MAKTPGKMARNAAEGPTSRFASDGGGMVLSQCVSCAHWKPGTWECTAFPKSIPEDIRDNKFDHREPFNGDGGVTFSPSDSVDRPALGALYAVLDEADPH